MLEKKGKKCLNDIQEGNETFRAKLLYNLYFFIT